MRYLLSIIISLSILNINVKADSWSTAGNIITGRNQHTTTLLNDGSLLIVGGKSSNSSDQTTVGSERYNPETGNSILTSPNIHNRKEHRSTKLLDGRVLVTGGEYFFYNPSKNSEITNSVEIYNPEEDSWTELAPMRVGRSSHSAILLADGNVLIIGGTNSGQKLTSCELYDVSSNTWTDVDSLNYASGWGGSAVLLNNGKVLLVGGVGSGICQLYDPSTNEWSNTSGMTYQRPSPLVTKLINGDIFVAGWPQYTSNTFHSEIYNVGSSSFSSVSTPSSLTYQAASSIITLLDGRVLMSGQDTNSETEIFDPNTQSFQSGGSLNTVRTDHTMTLLSDGRVAIVGGYGNDYPSSDYFRKGVEIFSYAPTILEQPNDTTINQGRAALFEVTAGGSTLIYQWYKDGVPLEESNENILIIENAQLSDEGSYTVSVSNAGGSTESQAVTLSIIPDADSDGLADTAETNTGIFVDSTNTGTNPDESDSDGDTVSDYDEIFGTTPSNPNLLDTDSDGFDDGFELETGYDPSDSESSPDVISGIENAVYYWFNSASDGTYRIDYSENLIDWSALEEGIQGNGARIDRYYRIIDQPKRYFRSIRTD